jgi:hypothetical protein
MVGRTALGCGVMAWLAWAGHARAQPLDWGGDFSLSQQGLNGTIHEIIPFGAELVGVGNFFEAGGVRTNYVAAWNGESWRPLGSGGAFNGGGFSNVAYCAAVYRGELHAGGFFTQLGQAGGARVNRVARWDGIRWNAVGTGGCVGVTGGFGQVRAMTVFDDRLVVGGSFAAAGCVAAANLAVWNGSVWSAIPGEGTNDFVNALAVHGDLLVIGGAFTRAGGLEATGLVAYDGEWVALAGNGLDTLGEVFEAASIDGQLYIGGNFNSINGVRAADIARYDGTWHPLGSGMSGVSVTAIAPFLGRLYASGLFTAAGGVPASGIAAWDGNAWSPLGSGINGLGLSLANYDGALFVGGTFTQAGGLESSHVARWGKPPCRADLNEDGFVDFFDYLEFVTDFESGDFSSDFNRDGFLDFFDYLMFVEAFEAGC